tara:strand:+ start:1979 stop:3205 length:1227 start_codon:yes stop_codon:yes gene_type:complete
MKFKNRNLIGNDEIREVNKVLKSGKLSSFVAEKGPEHHGGKYVKKFESSIKAYFKTKYAISVNSWTSGLICAVGALQLEPGDEVIVSPWTMSATVTAILHWNLIPIFADINEDDFCLNFKDVKKKITNKTRAIMSVDIFGRSANINELKKISKKYDLKIISDTAQAIGSKYYGKYSGTLTDIGGYSLNYHKHIHCGEGGVLVTNNKRFAENIRYIRNHAEVVIQTNSKKRLNNMLGYNFRMTEIDAAISYVQLKKLKKIIKRQNELASILYNGIKDLKGIKLPKKDKNITNSYYVFPIIYDENKTKISRKNILKLLKKNGIPSLKGGYQNLHLLPLFKKKIAYGKNNFPWSYTKSRKNVKYYKGMCPVAEKYHDKEFISFGILNKSFNKKDIEFIIRKFKYVWKQNIK